jgi:hypothetical protein
LQGGDVKIKHVVFLKLESARADIFPLQKDSFMYKRIAEILALMPPYALRPLKRASSCSNPLGKLVRYSAVRVRFTSATYTLKSLTGSFCGVTPLVADFNREFDHHIYQVEDMGQTWLVNMVVKFAVEIGDQWGHTTETSRQRL